ncbi:hypothetical protein ABZT17_27115 [Streptomyces sp. NPDC005648]|uniref:hypothetical protein n=1 Tax=Streptomyces sp. NPDC005648 TaxID=3157044 RepID=UPI0033AB88CD
MRERASWGRKFFEPGKKTLDLRPPRLPLLSDTTAGPVKAEAASPEAWVRAMRAPVRFADAVARMHRDGVTAYLELGPGEVLTGMLDGCLPARAVRPLTLSMARDRQAPRTAADVA